VGQPVWQDQGGGGGRGTLRRGWRPQCCCMQLHACRGGALLERGRRAWPCCWRARQGREGRGHPIACCDGGVEGGCPRSLGQRWWQVAALSSAGRAVGEGVDAQLAAAAWEAVEAASRTAAANCLLLLLLLLEFLAQPLQLVHISLAQRLVASGWDGEISKVFELRTSRALTQMRVEVEEWDRWASV